MCGLIGAAGALEPGHLMALQKLGALISLRGEDSIGYLDFVPGRKNFTIRREVEHPNDFFFKRRNFVDAYFNGRYQALAKKPAFLPSLVAVHARAATIGVVTKQNCHPFSKKDIIGMHNGTVREHGYSDKFGTDSERIINDIAEDEKKTLEDLTSSFLAAYALVWVNKTQKTLNFIRNEQRPLFIFSSGDGKVIMWASDEHWLRGVLPYYGIKGKTETLPINTKLTVDYTNLKNVVATSKVETITARRGATMGFTVKPEESGKLERPAVEKSVYRRRADLGGAWMTDAMYEVEKRRASEGLSTVVPFVEKGKEKEPHTSFLRDANGYFKIAKGFSVSLEKFKYLISKGCRSCLREIPLDEHVIFLSESAFMCEKCKTDHDRVDAVINELDEEEKKSA